MSVSQLGTFDRCERQYHYVYNERMKRPPGIALIRGKAGHRGVEVDLTTKLETGELATVEQVRDEVATSFDAEMAREGSELPAEEKPEAPKAKDDAIAMATYYHDVIAPGVEPTHLERELRVDIDGYPYGILCYLDIQEGARRVRDAKFRGKSPGANDAHHSVQLTAYALAVRIEDQVDLEELRLDTLWTTKRDGAKGESQKTTRGAADYLDLLRRVQLFIEAKEAGIYRPAPKDSWACASRFCGFYDSVCPFGRRGRTQG